MALAGIQKPIYKQKYKNRRYKKKFVSVPKKKKVAKSYVRSNSMAINTLARKVKSLQMSQYGPIQTNFQVPNATFAHLTPTAALPILTDLCDFTCSRVPGEQQNGCKFFQYNAGGNLTQGSMYSFAGLTDNPYWRNYNQNQPGEIGVYLPISATYTISIEGNPSLDDTRVRFDVFTQRTKPLLQSAGTLPANQGLVLPRALNHMANMATPEVNRINRQYFKPYFTRVFYINSSKTATTKGTTGNTARFRFTIRPKKPRKQLIVTGPSPTVDDILTAQQEIEDALNDHLDESEHSSTHDDIELTAPPAKVGLDFGPFNTVLGSQLWMLISTDDITATGTDAVNVKVSRHVKWRDFVGSTAN